MKNSDTGCSIGLPTSYAFGAVLAAALIALPAFAQQPVERVEITGSSIKRIEGEGSLPVQIITREQIEASGASNAEQFLQTLGVAVQGNNNTVAASASGATTGGVSGASLRGLGSQRTLVLIDGRRVSGGGTITDSTTVDVNHIPASAIERIEVLKDGASAIYGSDAIAGVINFILRKDYKGGEVTVHAAGTNDGGGGVKRANGMIGFGDINKDRYSVTLLAGYQKEDALFGRDRSFARSGINNDFLNDTTSGNTFPGNISVPRLGGRSNATRNPGAPGCPPPYSILDTPNFPSSRCRFDPSPLVTLLPKTEQTSFFGNLRFKLTQEVEAYGQFSYSSKETRSVIQPVPISDQFALPPNHPLFNVAPYNGLTTILLRSTSPFYPAALIAGIPFVAGGGAPDVLVRYRSEATGNRDLTDISDQKRAVLGVKGVVFSKWDFDAAYLHADTKLTERVNGGYPSLSAILPILNSGTVNFFGPNSAAVDAQLKGTNFLAEAYSTKTTIDSVTAKVSADIAKLPAGPLALAVGAEARREGFNVNPSAAIAAGDISGYGGNFLPIDKSRNVSAVFAEVNIPIVRSLEATAAARYDDYQGTGSRTTPKASLRWQPAKETLFRASAGGGFRAPSLTEIFQPQVTGVTAPGLTDPARCPTTNSSNDCQTQFPILLGGNTALKSETSKNYTIGFVLEPTNNVSLGLDFFQIDLKNTIIFGVQPSAILLDQVKYGSLITRGPVDVAGIPGPITSINQLNTNLGETHVRGVDVNLLYRVAAGQVGTFTFGLNGTRLQAYTIQNPDLSFSSIAGMVSPIVNGSGGVIPTWRHYAYADWKRGPWNAVFSQSYQSGYKDIPGTFEDTSVDLIKHENVKRYQTFNLVGSYTGLKGNALKIQVGLKNMFNTSPPYTNAGGQNYFQAGYDPGYVDPRGRMFFGTVTYKFK